MKDLYFLAVKIFLRKKDELFIFKDRFSDWDLPGGRVKTTEFRTPFPRVLERKIREELGGNVKYKLQKRPIVFFRHERKEHDLKGRKVRIFALGYEARFLKGELKLSKMHTEYKWVDIKKFKPERYFRGGWLQGVREYKRIKL